MSASSSAPSQGRLGRARRTGPGRRILGGVASGLADALDLDPLVVRVAFAYLSLFGGLVATGVLLVRRPGHGRLSDPDRSASRLRGHDTGSNYSGKEI